MASFVYESHHVQVNLVGHFPMKIILLMLIKRECDFHHKLHFRCECVIMQKQGAPCLRFEYDQDPIILDFLDPKYKGHLLHQQLQRDNNLMTHRLCEYLLAQVFNEELVTLFHQGTRCVRIHRLPK